MPTVQSQSVGQRNKDYLADLYVYSVDTDTVVYQAKDTARSGGPEAGFTQRACFDPVSREMHLFSGLFKDQTAASTSRLDQTRPASDIWTWHADRHVWSCVASAPGEEPVPRYAHQIVYDADSRIHYMFGGNPGVCASDAASAPAKEAARHTRRLDDFWQLEMCKAMTPDDVLRRMRFLLRRQQYLLSIYSCVSAA